MKVDLLRVRGAHVGLGRTLVALALLGGLGVWGATSGAWAQDAGQAVAQAAAQDAPAPVSSPSPAPVSSQSPAPVSSPSPAPVSSQSPAPVSSQSPAPTGADTPPPVAPSPQAPVDHEGEREVALLAQILRDPVRREALITALSHAAAGLPQTVAAPASAPAPADAKADAKADGGAADGADDGDDLPARILTLLTDHIEDLSQEIADAGQALIDAPRAVRWLDKQVSDPALRRQWALLVGEVALVLAAGYIGRVVAVWALARPRRILEGWGLERQMATLKGLTGGLVLRLGVLVARTLLDSLPVLAFLAAAYGTLSLTHPPRIMGMAAVGIIMSSLLVQAIMLAGRFLLSPGSAALRLVRLSDESANYAYIWLRRVALTAVYGYFIAQVAYRLGLPPKPYMAALKLVGLVVGAMLVVVVLQNRQDVGDWLRGDRRPALPPTPEGLEPEDGALEATLAAEGAQDGAAPPLPVWLPLDGMRHRLADIWHILTIVYLMVLYGIWALDVKSGFEFVARATLVSLGAVVGARVLMGGLDHLIRRGFAVPEDLRTLYPGLEARANRYLPLLRRVCKTVTWGAAALVVLQAWGMDSFGWLASPFGKRATASILTILLAVVLALVVWELVSSVIERYLVGIDPRGRRVERSARARTLLPLLRNALLVFLIITVGLISLSALGMDIGPLLAGAGVIGVAVGFGSQTLVKDLITGLFILFEDTIAVGDSISVGGLSGTVEGLSIRTIRLRDDTGVLHTVPFSSVGSISNNSKGYAVYSLTLAVDYREDTAKVLETLRAVGEELAADADAGPLMLSPPDVLGVSALGDGAMKIKAVVRTRPGMKERVGREWNRRIKEAFIRHSITLASSSPTVILAPLAPAVPGETDAPAQSGQPVSSGASS